MDSLTLSLVGRSPGPVGPARRRPPAVPATTLIGYAPSSAQYGARFVVGGGGGAATVQPVRAPATIVCVDCGGTCHLLGHPDHDLEPGDSVAYRCELCMDRWDIVMADDEPDL